MIKISKEAWRNAYMDPEFCKEANGFKLPEVSVTHYDVAVKLLKTNLFPVQKLAAQEVVQGFLEGSKPSKKSIEFIKYASRQNLNNINNF